MEALDEDPNLLDSTRVVMFDVIQEDSKTEKSVNFISHPPRINAVRVGSPDMFPELDPNYQSDCECTPSSQSVSVPCVQLNTTSSFDSELSLGPAHQSLFSAFAK